MLGLQWPQCHLNKTMCLWTAMHFEWRARKHFHYGWDVKPCSDTVRLIAGFLPRSRLMSVWRCILAKHDVFRGFWFTYLCLSSAHTNTFISVLCYKNQCGTVQLSKVFRWSSLVLIIHKRHKDPCSFPPCSQPAPLPYCLLERDNTELQGIIVCVLVPEIHCTFRWCSLHFPPRTFHVQWCVTTIFLR